MKSKGLTYYIACLCALWLLFGIEARAQDSTEVVAIPADSVEAVVVSSDSAVFVFAEPDSVAQAVMSDSTLNARVDSVAIAIAEVDSLMQFTVQERKEVWIPNPKKAMWLAIVFPGGGQIYNRKYWKLPIVYGGLLGCVYALNWNSTMYRDYSQAYIDIMDDDPNSKSYENFVPPSYDVNRNMERLKSLFKRKKDFYRRYRDLSIFCMIGVYAFSILDAYIDAELSSFDISRDLSMKVRPTIINDRKGRMRTDGIHSNSYGLQCSFSF